MSGEARRRLAQFGPNAMPDTAVHPLRRAVEKLWAPVPRMLEAAIVLQSALGDYTEAAMSGALLVSNAALGFVHEERAQATLTALRSRLALTASVRRDDRWMVVPAAELVTGDAAKLSLRGLVAADVRLVFGEVLLDHSMLTGESVPIEAGPGLQTFAGALIRRGEAVGEVTATGAHTTFGRTAELVRTAHVVSPQQKAVLSGVRNLAAFRGCGFLAIFAYACALSLPLAEIVPLILTAVLASIPVALPATFTLASAIGARALRQARIGIAVSTAPDVAKSAAGMMLIEPGLGGIVAVVKEGRVAFQRTLTYTLNSITKKISTVVRSMPQFGLLFLRVVLTMNMLSGGNTPLESEPRILQIAVECVASTHFVSFAEAILFRGAAFSLVFRDYLEVAGLGSLFFVLSGLRFRRTSAMAAG